MKQLKMINLAALGLGLIAAGCSSELPDTPDGEMQDVVFTANIPADLSDRGNASRAFGEATTDMMLTYAVYEKGATDPVLKSDREIAFENKSATVKLRLPKGKTYEMVFWASAAGETSPYTFSASDRTITINYAGLKSSDDSRDAFFAHEEVTISTVAQTIELKRPFAQLNIGTTDMKEAGFDPATTTLSARVGINGLPTTLNLWTGEVSGSADVVYEMADAPKNETFPVGTDVYYLAMNYVLVGDAVGENKTVTDVNLTVNNGSEELVSSTIESVPFSRNFRTNISGNLLTDEASINITITPAFGGADTPENPNQDLSEPASRTAADGSKIYQVATADDLRWIQTQSSSRTPFWDNNSFELTADIDLSTDGNPEVWTPINVSSAARDVEINGNGHSVTGYTFAEDAGDNLGLFGTVDNAVISGFTVRDVTYNGKSQQNVGALVGQTTGRLVDVHAENVEISLPNGAKVGAIAGTVSGLTDDSSDYMITGASVERSNIHGSEAVGAVAGYYDNVAVTRAIGQIFFIVNDQTITNTVVTSSDNLEGLLAGETSDNNSTVFYSQVKHSANSTEALIGRGKIDQAADLMSTTTPYDEASKTYRIYNIDQLFNVFANWSTKQGNISLMSDINAHGYEHTSIVIPELSEEIEFNGNGHTISNLKINGQGLFVSQNSTLETNKYANVPVRNLTVRNLTLNRINLNANGGRSGVLFNQFSGNMERVDLIDCTLSEGTSYAGGFFGLYESGTLTNCHISGLSISASSSAGMIAGYMGPYTKLNSEYQINLNGCSVTNSAIQSATKTGVLMVGKQNDVSLIINLTNFVNSENNPSNNYPSGLTKVTLNNL